VDKNCWQKNYIFHVIIKMTSEGEEMDKSNVDVPVTGGAAGKNAHRVFNFDQDDIDLAALEEERQRIDKEIEERRLEMELRKEAAERRRSEVESKMAALHQRKQSLVERRVSGQRRPSNDND
jgi:flagellar motility protein MotE (MotC chaperone)